MRPLVVANQISADTDGSPDAFVKETIRDSQSTLLPEDHRHFDKYR
jgi:hypothetical protein